MCSARSSRMDKVKSVWRGSYTAHLHVANETSVSVFLGLPSFHTLSSLSPSGHIFSPRTQNHRQNLRSHQESPVVAQPHSIGIKCRHDPCACDLINHLRSLTDLAADPCLPIKCGRRTPSMASRPRTPWASTCTTLHR